MDSSSSLRKAWLSQQAVNGGMDYTIADQVQSIDADLPDVATYQQFAFFYGRSAKVHLQERPWSVRRAIGGLNWPLAQEQYLVDYGDLDAGALQELYLLSFTRIQTAVKRGCLPILIQENQEINEGFFVALFTNRFAASTQIEPSSLVLGPKSDPTPGIIRFSADLMTKANGDHVALGDLMLNLFNRNRALFSGIQLGVQEATNTPPDWERAKALKLKLLTMLACGEEVMQVSLANYLATVSEVMLSIDLGVFSDADVSKNQSPSAFGLNLHETLRVLQWLMGTGKVKGLEITGLKSQNSSPRKNDRLTASMLQLLLAHWF